MKTLIKILFIATIFFSCNEQKKEQKTQEIKKPIEKTIAKNSKEILKTIKPDIVVAHRGSTFWTPEETEPAFLWARNIGADYLEFDIQLTKDNQLIAFHDKTLERTTNVENIFPERKTAEINEFTLEELRSLDDGSKFNEKFPERARKSFVGLKIMTMQDVIMIAEGFRIKKVKGIPVKKLVDGKWNGNYEYEKDPSDNGNRPGLYIETKNPKPGVEKAFTDLLNKNAWNINTEAKEIATTEGKVAVANTKARIILQSFSLESLIKLEELVPQIPKCLLLWQPKMLPDIKASYNKAIDFCIENNVQILGPSIAGEPNNYKELCDDWMLEMAHKSGLAIHAYTFDTNEQFEKYAKKVEGVFTNRSDLALAFYGRKSEKTPEEILKELGY